MAVLLFYATVIGDVLGSDADLYDALVERMTTVHVQQGAGLAPDVSALICPVVTTQQLQRLSDTRPGDVKPNVELSENATGFPPGTTHWLVRGKWLGVWERMTFAINLNDEGFCQAFAVPLVVEEPNFDFERTGI
ncbi:MAG TPA: hypothetical protein VIL88_17870 [Devosia sp.]|uniref:hypothetical protein n=1 Tax=Devosia sp. TaxID=1871048 RepID=UPI002F92F7DC